MHQQVEIEPDEASSSSSTIGSSSFNEDIDIDRLKNPRSRPNYLKATSSSEKKKMNNQATNLTESESTTVSSDSNKPVLQNMKTKSKPSPYFKRNTSIRSLRILMSKPKSFPQVTEGERVIKATCSSTLKDSKIPLVEVEPEERETEKISALRVCTYSYCSLHGHHNHSSTPTLKRLLSKRRRFSKTQKGIKVRTQSGTNDLINDTNTRQLVGNEDSKGRKKGKNGKVVASDTKIKVNKGDESISEPVVYDDVAKENELRGGKKKRMSMWYLIHKQMISGLAPIQENQGIEIQKSSSGNNEISIENKEMRNQDLEIRKNHATKMVREAIEKILLPEVPDQFPDEMSICSNASQHELLEKQNPNEDAQGEKARVKAPKSWSNFKKLILLNKFVKELEKVKKIDPEKPAFLSVEQDEEGKKVSLRGKGLDTKKSAEEWMLDYALQQAVSELAPTQKRKVELLIKAYETMVTPIDGEKSPLSFHKLKGISNERGHMGETFVDDEEKKNSTFSDEESNVLVKEQANQGVIKAESNLSKQSQEGDDVIKDPNEDDSEESLVASSFSETDTIEQFNKDEDVNSSKTIITMNQQPNCKKSDFADVSPPSDPKLDPTIDNETENRIQAFKSKFTKPKNMSMWHLIHQQMVAGLEDGGKTKQNENNGENENEEGAIESNPESECYDMESQEVELRKVFAIKMVREAIEKILLPEVQDDQSTTSETVSENELIIEKKQDEDWGSQILNSFGSIRDDPTHYSTNKVMYDMSLTQEMEQPQEVFSETEKKETKPEKRTEKQAPKRWSNLKKWILLQRFVKELEKVKNFKLKKPELLPLKLDPEGEVVRLRNQMMNEKRNAEEWMLDYALRKVVSELAPKQKKKVELLVKAFETVVPSTEEVKSPVIFPKSTRNEVDKAKNIFAPKIDDGNKNSPFAVQNSEVVSIASEGNVNKIIGHKSNVDQSEKQKHMKMWHLLCQHVVSDIAAKIESDDVSPRENPTADQTRVDEDPTVEFSKSDAVKLVRDAIEEILVPDTQDDSSDTPLIASDISQDQELLEEKKPRNWDKLKKLILLKRSIKALEKARRLNIRVPCQPSLESGHEEEKVDLKYQLSDERKKAEEWMLDYAVQHIVTKLTPARKMRVSMLVEAFEAVVPLPQI